MRIDRPQPRLDLERGGGMAVTVGRVRPCPILDIRMVVLGHNTVRGAAGQAVQIAELLVAEGRVDRPDDHRQVRRHLGGGCGGHRAADRHRPHAGSDRPVIVVSRPGQGDRRAARPRRRRWRPGSAHGGPRPRARCSIATCELPGSCLAPERHWADRGRRRSALSRAQRRRRPDAPARPAGRHGGPGRAVELEAGRGGDEGAGLNVHLDGRPADHGDGRTFTPGHALDAGHSTTRARECLRPLAEAGRIAGDAGVHRRHRDGARRPSAGAAPTSRRRCSARPWAPSGSRSGPT